MATSAGIEVDLNYGAAQATLAKALAPEEVRPGDYVTPLYAVAEVPSFWWYADAWNLPPDEPVRLRFTSTCDGAPLRVKSVCLPFVLAKQSSGIALTIDLRRCQLARLDPAYAKRAWKSLKKSQRSGTNPCA
jgi:hypothetical protein